MKRLQSTPEKLREELSKLLRRLEYDTLDDIGHYYLNKNMILIVWRRGLSDKRRTSPSKRI
jgi:hypothetical protein